jgi:hypothetical protein
LLPQLLSNLPLLQHITAFLLRFNSLRQPTTSKLYLIKTDIKKGKYDDQDAIYYVKRATKRATNNTLKI